ncbi:hypothetical protein [Nocardia sp. CA-119907]
MPAPVIITVVAVSILYMGWIVLAVNWPTILGPSERRTPEVDAEQVDQ